MKYSYGTSGFRFHHTIIESISTKIGHVVSALSGDNHCPYGIMITASHNPYQDNGVKIINHKGEMIDEAEEKLITDYVNGYEEHDFKIKNMKPPEIFIGYDTRASSPTICKLIISGCKELSKSCIIHNCQFVSTPELHYDLYKYNTQTSESYIHRLNNICDKLNLPTGIICDCANGIGSKVLTELNCNVERIKLINTDCENFKVLNHKSGSDYVVNEKCIPSDEKQDNTLYVSLDGDADRVVFYYTSENNFYLLNGDKISALIAYYISQKVSNLNNIAVIHTGYSNDAFIKFIHSMGIKTVCTSTGVKNLHHEALKYDISIYFESNGHGTVLFNKKYPELSELQEFFHPTIGDGIMDMLAVIYILQEMEMEIDDWNDFYQNNPYKLFKMEVNDKSYFETTKDEVTLTKPEKLQNYIHTICKDGTRAFVRPSGTENYLRVYVESDSIYKVNMVSNHIEKFIKKNYQENEFEKNNTIFEISHLSKDDYHSNYFHLLKQLTEIDPNDMSIDTFCKFVEKLNENHIIKLIKIKESQKVVGSITVLIEEKLIHNFGRVAHIEDVVVDESMRGFGLGKKLLEIAESECYECYKIILDCSDDNIKFYEKCGYEWKGNEMAKYTTG
jgi:phosphoacetylglucosamine mutase